MPDQTATLAIKSSASSPNLFRSMILTDSSKRSLDALDPLVEDLLAMSAGELLLTGRFRNHIVLSERIATYEGRDITWISLNVKKSRIDVIIINQKDTEFILAGISVDANFFEEEGIPSSIPS